MKFDFRYLLLLIVLLPVVFKYDLNGVLNNFDFCLGEWNFISNNLDFNLLLFCIVSNCFAVITFIYLICYYIYFYLLIFG